MENVVIVDNLYADLNMLYSLNFLALENQEKIKSKTQGNNIHYSKDIFSTQKSYHDCLLDARFDFYATARNQIISEINNNFDTKGWIEQYQNIAMQFCHYYSLLTKKNINGTKIFGNREIINPAFFEQLRLDIDTDKFGRFNSKQLAELLSEFNEFYQYYKKIISVADIYNVVKDDITPYGSKSLMYGISPNKDVLSINVDDLGFINDEILIFLDKKHKKISKNSFDFSVIPEDFEVQKLSIENILCVIYSRFVAATKNNLTLHSKLKQNLQDFVYSGEIYKKFNIPTIYIHRIELEDLLKLVKNFPELTNVAEKIESLLYPKNVNLSQNSTKENT